MTTATVECWRTIEIVLTAEEDHAQPFADVSVDAEFIGPDGLSIRRPAFWDGGRVWRVRFAPTRVGRWTMTTTSTPADPGLHGVATDVLAVEYTGELDVYRHGFVRVDDSGHHLEHQDGTPFFYLGDTHWALPHERWDTSNAPGVESQLRYVVDKRRAQGFTAYQSEPIWHPHPQGVQHLGEDEEAIADLRHGVTASALAGLRRLDKKFEYIADAGLLHANAMIDWVARPAEFPEDFTPALMRHLATYWCARYGSYPVIWTIGQEIDADFYGVYRGEAMAPWSEAMEALRSADAYRHPLFPHQENTNVTRVKNSRFAHEPWHDGFAAQPQWDDRWDPDVLAEYWSSGKPALAYETPYELFWADGRHALSALYKSYLGGMRGYGYGISGLWNDVYSTDHAPLDAGTEFELVAGEETVSDSVELGHQYNPETRRVWWFDAANSTTGDQLAIGAQYFRSIEWWSLTPRFADPSWSDFTLEGSNLLATSGNDLYVAIFADGTDASGTLRRLAPSSVYVGFWFDPRTGERHRLAEITPDASGNLPLPAKPSAEDWVLQIERILPSAEASSAPSENTLGDRR